MFKRTRTGISGFFGTFGNAIAAAAAVNQGRVPHAHDLRALGIDPKQFRQIGRF